MNKSKSFKSKLNELFNQSFSRLPNDQSTINITTPKSTEKVRSPSLCYTKSLRSKLNDLNHSRYLLDYSIEYCRKKSHKRSKSITGIDSNNVSKNTITMTKSNNFKQQIENMKNKYKLDFEEDINTLKSKKIDKMIRYTSIDFTKEMNVINRPIIYNYQKEKNKCNFNSIITQHTLNKQRNKSLKSKLFFDNMKMECGLLKGVFSSPETKPIRHSKNLSLKLNLNF